MIAGITVKNGRKKKSMNTDPERNLFYIFLIFPIFLIKKEKMTESLDSAYGFYHSIATKIWRKLTMAKKAKGNRVQVILECTEHKESGMPGTSRYITTKNRKNTTERLELKKYNPILKRVTVHKEIK